MLIRRSSLFSLVCISDSSVMIENSDSSSSFLFAYSFLSLFSSKLNFSRSPFERPDGPIAYYTCNNFSFLDYIRISMSFVFLALWRMFACTSFISACNNCEFCLSMSTCNFSKFWILESSMASLAFSSNSRSLWNLSDLASFYLFTVSESISTCSMNYAEYQSGSAP